MERPPGNRRSVQIPLTTRARVSRDVDEELTGHLAMRVEELVRSGMPRDAAERQARAQFGDLDAARQALIAEDMQRETHARRRWSLESWRQDVRYAWRQLVTQRVFTVVALLTLALGTGVTMAIFSVVDGVLLRPLPFERPDELVRLFSDRSWQPPLTARSFSVPDFADYRKQSTAFRGLAAYYDGTTNYIRSGRSRPSQRNAGKRQLLCPVRGTRPRRTHLRAG